MTALHPKGFSIAVDAHRHLIKVQAWGFWDLDVARKYENTFTEKIHEVYSHSQCWSILVDFRGLFPQSEEVLYLIEQQFVKAEQYGLRRIGCLREGLALQVLLKDALEKQDVHTAFFNSEDEALRWLAA